MGDHIQYYYSLFIAEYMEQGALFDFLHQNAFDSDRNLMWARQIAAGEYISADFVVSSISNR